MWEREVRIYGTPGVPNNFPLLYVAPQLTQGNFQVSNIVHSEIFGIYLVSKFKNTGWNLWKYDWLNFIWQRQKPAWTIRLSILSLVQKAIMVGTGLILYIQET